MNKPVPVSAGLLFLIGLTGASMSVFSDTVIGALPALQAALNASDYEVQLLISLFFVTTALMSLFAGALADAYGRRPVLIGALLLLISTSVGCIVSSRVEQLWVMRALQGMAACVGMILSRTLVRDLLSGLAAQKAISRISLIQSVAPVLTPLMGAWVGMHYGWRMVFVCTGGLALILLVCIARYLPESLPRDRRQPARPAALLNAYGIVFGSSVFWRMASVQALNWAAVFLYIAAAPKVMTVHLGLATTDVFQMFAAMMVPMMLGLMVLPPLLQRVGTRSVMIGAYVCFLIGIVMNLAIGVLGLQTRIVMLPLALCSLAVAISLPLLVGEALEPFPDNSGMASSCQMFIQYVFMGLTAGILAPLAWGSLFGLALAQAGMLALGFVLMLWQQSTKRKPDMA